MTVRANVYNSKGKVEGKVVLPSQIFAAPINKKLIAQAVRVYLANQRQGTASTKTRGEISGSRRKIWRQKGTGRARHGDRYAPVFVGGGVAHGPKPKDFSLKLSKKMRRKALFACLTLKLKQKSLIVISDLAKLKPKTKKILEVLKNLKVDTQNSKLKEKTLLVVPKEQENIIIAGRNLENLSLSSPELLNPFEILNSKKLVLVKGAILKLKKTFLGEKK